MPRARSARPLTETSDRPEGLTQRVVLNILEGFFKRPLVHLLPLVLLLGLGTFVALNAPKQYRSIGVLETTSGSLLQDLTESGQQTIGFDPPATVTARNLRELVHTSTFLNDIIVKAGLGTAIQQGLVTHDEIRASIETSAQGDNLVSVLVTSERPEQAQRIAQATMDAFVDHVVSNNIGDLELVVTTYEGTLARTRNEFQQAEDDLDTYVIAHPEPEEGERPVEEEQAIGRFNRSVELAQEAHTTARENLEQARTNVASAAAVVNRQLRIHDVPEVPESPEPRMMKAALTVVMFGFLGAILSLAAVVLSALLDRTVRIPNDISAKFDLEVLAVVPSARKR